MKKRPEDVDAVLLLTPTISNMAQTPNGRKLSVSRSFILVVVLACLTMNPPSGYSVTPSHVSSARSRTSLA